MKIKTSLGIYEYIAVVNDIAEPYFDNEGNYQPHMGLINAMKAFFNYCVTDSKYDSDEYVNMDDDDRLDMLIGDHEFVSAFNEAIRADMLCLDFANAYRDALDIVATKKSTIEHILKRIKSMADSISTLITPETMNRIESIVDKIQNGNLDVDSLLKTYVDSDVFQDLLNSHVKDTEYVKKKDE